MKLYTTSELKNQKKLKSFLDKNNKNNSYFTQLVI